MGIRYCLLNHTYWSPIENAALRRARLTNDAGLTNDVHRIIEKRKKDIVSTLCLAAAIIVPGLEYLKEGGHIYSPDEGKQALMSVIDRYYLGYIVKQIEALKVYKNFRDKTGLHFGSKRMKYMAVNDTADNISKVSVISKTC